VTITRDLFAARNRPFGLVLELDYEGAELPLTGASISTQVRQYAGQPGAPIGEHADVPFTDAAHDSEPGLRTLRIEPALSRATLEAMPTGLNAPEVGEADRHFHEIKLTYADGAQDTLWTGAFFLEPGVDDT
jgi:hypothetical protein